MTQEEKLKKIKEFTKLRKDLNEIKAANEYLRNLIILTPLLKDNCKLAKEMWGIQKISHYEAGFDCVDTSGCCVDCGEKWPRYRYFLLETLDILISGDSIQEYINKTKI